MLQPTDEFAHEPPTPIPPGWDGRRGFGIVELNRIDR
jgi:hypothetical protein